MKDGEARLFYDVSEVSIIMYNVHKTTSIIFSQDLSHLVVVKVGSKDPSEGQEDILVQREDVRVAAGGVLLAHCSV